MSCRRVSRDSVYALVGALRFDILMKVHVTAARWVSNLGDPTASLRQHPHPVDAQWEQFFPVVSRPSQRIYRRWYIEAAVRKLAVDMKAAMTELRTLRLRQASQARGRKGLNLPSMSNYDVPSKTQCKQDSRGREREIEEQVETKNTIT